MKPLHILVSWELWPCTPPLSPPSSLFTFPLLPLSLRPSPDKNSFLDFHELVLDISLTRFCFHSFLYRPPGDRGETTSSNLLPRKLVPSLLHLQQLTQPPKNTHLPFKLDKTLSGTGGPSETPSVSHLGTCESFYPVSDPIVWHLQTNSNLVYSCVAFRHIL